MQQPQGRQRDMRWPCMGALFELSTGQRVVRCVLRTGVALAELRSRLDEPAVRAAGDPTSPA